MTVVGYDTERLRVLRSAADDAARTLHSIRCWEPLAQDAIDEVRRLRLFLESTLVPAANRVLLTDTVATSSRVVGRWIGDTLGVLADAFENRARPNAGPWADATDDELFEALDSLSAEALQLLFDHLGDPDALAHLDVAALVPLAAELASRAAHDPSMWLEAAQVGYRWPILAALVPLA